MTALTATALTSLTALTAAALTSLTALTATALTSLTSLASPASSSACPPEGAGAPATSTVAFTIPISPSVSFIMNLSRVSESALSHSDERNFKSVFLRGVAVPLAT